MSLDKAIAHGKERRSQYKHSRKDLGYCHCRLCEARSGYPAPEVKHKRADIDAKEQLGRQPRRLTGRKG